METDFRGCDRACVQSCDPPSTEILENIWPVTVITVKRSQFRAAAWKHLLEAKLKVLSVTFRGFSVFIFMTCGSMWR